MDYDHIAGEIEGIFKPEPDEGGRGVVEFGVM